VSLRTHEAWQEAELVAERDAAIEARNAALAQLVDLQEALSWRLDERAALASSLDEATTTLQEYRRIIDEFNLPVSKGVGGKTRRTKDQVARDVIRSLKITNPRIDYPSHAEFKRELDNLRVGSTESRAFETIGQDVRRAMRMNRARLSEWVGDAKARKMMRQIVREDN
jgi:chaperonin cofactor prefoldin